jgi:hypothetical protein
LTAASNAFWHTQIDALSFGLKLELHHLRAGEIAFDALQPILPPNPKAGADHPLPESLGAEIQTVKLRQLRGRQ